MSNSFAKLMVAVFDKTVCVKIDGRADFTCSLDLKNLITELWQRGYAHFIFELSECRTMDSTFLGVLSGISLQLRNCQTTSLPLELFNPNPRICETLENLGVAHLFKVGGCEGPLTDKYEPLATNDSTSRLEIARTCLEAHKTLMDLKPENVQKFKDVAQFLAEDLKRLEVGQKP